MESKDLFVYGSFLDLDLVAEVIGHPVQSVRNDEIKGYTRVCGTLAESSKDGRFCMLVEEDDATVKGKVLALTDADLSKTDAWETAYERQEVTLMSGVQAFAYFLKPGETIEEQRISVKREASMATATDPETLTYDGTVIDDPDELLERLSQDCPGCLIEAGYPVSGDMAAVRQKVDGNAMMASFTIVTRTKDVNRHGNRVQILPGENGDGLQTADYQANPVVLFDHGLSGLALPIGRSRAPDGSLAMRFLKTKADADVYFSQTLPDAAVIFGLIDEDILRMASIGFMAQKGMRIKLDSNTKQDEEGVEDMRWPFGWDFTQSTLLEWSITPVGADAGAIRKSIDRQKINGYRMSQGLRMQLQQFAEKPKVWAPGVTLRQAVKPAELTISDATMEKILSAVSQAVDRKFEEKFTKGIDAPAQPITKPVQTIDAASVISEFRRQAGTELASTLQQLPSLIKTEIAKLTEPVINEQKRFNQSLNRALGRE